MSALISVYYLSLYYDIDPNTSILAIASLHWNQTRNARGRTGANKDSEGDLPGMSFTPEVLVSSDFPGCETPLCQAASAVRGST